MASAEQLQEVVLKVKELEAKMVTQADLNEVIMDVLAGKLDKIVVSAAANDQKDKKKAFRPIDLIPEVWSGPNDKVPFSEYTSDVHNYILAVNEEGEKMLTVVEAMEEWSQDQLDIFDMDEESKKQLNKDLYTILRKTTTGGPKTIVRNTTVGEGFKAWYRLMTRFDPKNTLDRNTAHAQVAAPKKRATNVDTSHEMFQAWNTQLIHYESRFGEMPNETKISAIKQLMPKQLLENRYRGITKLKFETFIQDIENYINDRALEHDSEDNKPQNGDLSELKDAEPWNEPPGLDAMWNQKSGGKAKGKDGGGKAWNGGKDGSGKGWWSGGKGKDNGGQRMARWQRMGR